MSISDWLSAREKRRYTRLGDEAQPVPVSAPAEMPDGTWQKCEACKRTLYEQELADNLDVCKYCGHHMPMTAPERIELLADSSSFVEIDAELSSCDPLEFVAAKTYADSLASAKGKSELEEAVVIGTATINGAQVVIGAMDFRFIGASMGSVVGEKVTRAFELATSRRLPVVLAVASGGARMQEGMLSLMQMAKTAAAAQVHAQAGLPYISILTHPTFGGVTASFAVLADVIVAEPGATIGFAGDRIIEQTIHQKLPKGFRSSEFMLAHGMIDEVVPRDELVDRVSALLGYMQPRPASQGGVA
jgi:acetyl-CoA carboxylase carboxyl transferase subunit beta